LLIGRLQKEQENDNSKGKEKYIIRAPKIVMWMGVVWAGITIALALLNYLNNEIYVVYCSVPFILLGLFCMAATIPGFWDILVDGDNITVVLCWIIRKHFKFSEIRCVVFRYGEAWVYINKRRRRAFMVDTWNDNYDVFEKRLKKLKVPFYIKKVKEKDK
jgi:hypothetical protein